MDNKMPSPVGSCMRREHSAIDMQTLALAHEPCDVEGLHRHALEVVSTRSSSWKQLIAGSLTSSMESCIRQTKRLKSSAVWVAAQTSPWRCCHSEMS